MRTIWKYEVGPDIRVPIGAKVVHTGYDGDGVLCVWLDVNTKNKPVQKMSFLYVGTGHRIEDESVYVGTVNRGPFVWHVFEDKT